MKQRHLISAGVLLLLVTSCKTNYSFGHRDASLNPDARLAGLVSDYEKSKKGNASTNELVIDHSAAWLQIERLAVEYPRHVPTLMANAAIAYEEREKEKSKRYLDALFSVEHSHPDAAVLRSRVALDEGNMPLARRVLETQIAYTPYEAGVHEAYSSVLYMSRDLDGAIREINLAEKQGAPKWRVAYNRGLIAEAAGRHTDAQRYFQAAVDENPEFAPARARLAEQAPGS